MKIGTVQAILSLIIVSTLSAVTIGFAYVSLGDIQGLEEKMLKIYSIIAAPLTGALGMIFGYYFGRKQDGTA